jgi:hypothetical protein
MALDLKAIASQIPKILPGTGFFGDPASAEVYKQLIANYLATNPELAKVKVVLAPGATTGAFSPASNTVIMGVNNPAVLAHELGHATSVKPGTLYNKILQASRRANYINKWISAPLAIGAKVFMSPDTARQVLNYASLASAMLAAPTLSEELGASIEAMKKSPEKLKSLKTLVPAYATHVFEQTTPFTVYQIGRVLL